MKVIYELLADGKRRRFAGRYYWGRIAEFNMRANRRRPRAIVRVVELSK